MVEEGEERDVVHIATTFADDRNKNSPANKEEIGLVVHKLCCDKQSDFVENALRTRACHNIIERLEKESDDYYTVDEWLAITAALAEGRPFAKPLIADWIKAQLKAPPNTKLYEPTNIFHVATETSISAKANLFRLNRSVIMSKGLFMKVLHLICPKRILDQSVNFVRETLFDATLALSDSDIAVKAHLLNELMSVDWTDSAPSTNPEVIDQIVCFTLHVAYMYIKHEDIEYLEDSSSTPSLEAEQIVEWAAEANQRAVLAFSSYLYGNEIVRKIQEVHAMIMDKSLFTPFLLSMIQLYKLTYVWMGCGNSGFEAPGEIVWRVIDYLLERLHSLCATRESDKEKTPTVTLASPENDDDSLTGDWLESILQQVPAKLDEKSAADMRHSTEISMIESHISFLMLMLTTSVFDESSDNVIANVFNKIRAEPVGSMIMKHLQQVYTYLTSQNRISIVLQRRLMMETTFGLATGQSRAVVCLLVVGGSAEVRGELAALVVGDIVAKLERHSKSNDYDEILAIGDFVIARHCTRLLKRADAAKLAKRVVELLMGIDKEDVSESFIECLMSVLHMISRGGVDLISLAHIHSSLECPEEDPLFTNYVASWSVDPEFFGVSPSDWPSLLQHVVNFSCGRLSVCPAHTFPLITEETLDVKDVATGIYLIGLIPYLRTPNGREHVLKFNAHSPTFAKKLEDLLQPENLIHLTCDVVALFEAQLLTNNWKSLVYAFLRAMLNVSSLKLPLSNALLMEYMQLCFKINSVKLLEVCATMKEVTGIGRLKCLASIWKNPLLIEAISEHCLQKRAEYVLHEYVFRFLPHSKLIDLDSDKVDRVAAINKTDCGKDGFLDLEYVSQYVPGQEDISMVLNMIRDHLTSSSFSKAAETDNLDPVVSDTLTKWAISVSSSSQYGQLAVDKANIALRKLPADVLFSLRHAQLFDNLMAGATDSQPIQPFEKTSLRVFLANLLRDVMKKSSPKYSVLAWRRDHFESVCTYLDYCGDPEYKESLTPVLVAGFTEYATATGNLTESAIELKNHIIEVFSDRMHMLPVWLEKAECPVALLSALSPLINLFVENRELAGAEQTLLVALRSSVDRIVSSSLISELNSCYKIEVQTTDRQVQSVLNWRGPRYPLERPLSMVPQAEKHCVFREALQIMCKYGGTDTHHQILVNASSYIPEWLCISDENEQVMRGLKCLDNDKSIVWRLTVLTELLDYVTQLSLHVKKDNYGGYFSDSDTLKLLVNRKGGATALPTVIRKPDDTSRPVPANPLCTFTTTEKEFKQQHWYNCHTCNMIETTGVCSICAVNCHRGHDLSYSKFASFFCDCGSNGCGALRTTLYEAIPQQAAKGRTGAADQAASQSTVISMSPYTIPIDVQLEETEVLHLLSNLRDGLHKKVDTIDLIVSASLEVHNHRWTLDTRRENVRKSLNQDNGVLKMDYETNIMDNYDLYQQKSWSNSNASAPCVVEPRHAPDVNERNKGKDISHVLKFENGKQLWFVISEPGNTLLMYHWPTSGNVPKELDETRMDVEPIGFLGRRMSARDDKIAVTGMNDTLCMRFGKDGEILDKCVIKSPEVTGGMNNSVIKAIWAPERPALLAIAATQTVRIYDLTVDMDNCIEELVLPVGNVEDVVFVPNENTSEMYVMVLSSIANLYEHKLKCNDADTPSYFLTSTVELTGIENHGAAVSAHYSQSSNLLFISFDKGTWVTVIEKGDINREGHAWVWNRLELNDAVHCWQESSGVMACLTHVVANPIVYIYPTFEKIIVQKLSLDKAAYAHALCTSDSGDMIYSLPMYYEKPTISLFASNWMNSPDLWIKDLPSELCVVPDTDKEEANEELPTEDLVTLMEKCESLERVEASSPQLSVFYDNQDLTTRLNTVEKMPVTAIQMEKFSITLKMPDNHSVVRCIRIEVPKDKGPNEVTIMGRTYSLATEDNRMFDIRLTRSQSLKLDARSVHLEFSGRSRSHVSMTVISVRLYGVPKKEFGWPTGQMVPRAPLTLADKLLLQLLKASTQLANRHLLIRDRQSMEIMALMLSSPRSCHYELRDASSKMLRSITRKENKRYYKMRDSIVIEDLATFKRTGQAIPCDLMAEMALQMKYMMCTRWQQFWEIVVNAFGDSLTFMTFLRDEMSSMVGDPLPLLEVYTVLIFIMLTLEDPNAEETTKQYLGLYTDPKTCHLAQRIRLVAQTQIYSFSLSTRNDRSVAKSIAGTLNIMKWGGLRPFFHRTKILGPEEDPSDVVQMMGPLTTSDVLNQTDMFDLEAEWMIRLLNLVLAKIRDDGSTGSRPTERYALGRGDAVPSTSLLIFAIVLMAQLYPSRLLPTVIQLMGMIDFKADITGVDDANYRQFLLVRLISVLLSKCGEHVKNRNKPAAKDAADGKKLSSPVEEEPAVAAADVPLNAIETTAAADDEAPTTPGEKPKKKGNEKLLEQGRQVSMQIVNHLMQFGVMPYCLNILERLVPYWRQQRDKSTVFRAWNRDSAPQPHETTPLVSLSGLNNARDDYYALITDVALRLPAQMRKISKEVEFDDKWRKILCELVTYHHAPQVRRQSKKLLTAMCDGDKTACRALRDRHLMYSHIDLLKKKYSSLIPFSHQQLTEMIESVTAIANTANERPALWRIICEEQLSWLLQLASKVSDFVSSSIVELLVLAIRETPAPDGSEIHLADRIVSDDDNRGLLKVLLLRYLLGRDENKRWLLHGMMRSTIQLASRQNQAILIRILWTELWPLAPGLGSHAAQLADLLATYGARVLTVQEMQTLCENELTVIKDISVRMEEEGHSGSYRQMAGLGVGWKTMLMDTSPCLVCSDRKDTSELVKLTSIRQEARYTSSSMVIKLAGHYEISRMHIKLSEQKKHKLIKKITLLYCPKTCDSAVELKNSQDVWQRAATASVNGTDNEVVLSLAIPIVTSSIIISFPELSETRQSLELHCPRCSTVVQAHSGVCENCGENVFQCIKCRAISYDEREPFLCQSCGYCKYARIDISVMCRPLPGVPPITSDVERSMCIEAMSRLLIEMESTRAQLRAKRALCESLYLRTRPLPPVEFHVESPDAADMLVQTVPAVSPTKPPVHALMHTTSQYKANHDDLCLQTQQLIAFREELRHYDRATNRMRPLLHQAINQGFYSTSARCFGCLCASMLHSVAVLQSACEEPSCHAMLLQNEVIYKDLVDLGHLYEPLREEVEQLLCRLAQENEKGTKRLCDLALSGKVHGNVLAKSLTVFPDTLWQLKLKTLIRCAMRLKDENTTLCALSMLEKYAEDARALRKRIQQKLYKSKRHMRSRDTESSEMKLQSEGGERRRIRVSNNPMPGAAVLGHWLSEDETSWTSAVEGDWKKNEQSQSDAMKILKEYDEWMWSCVFSPWITVRAAACSLMVAASKQPGHAGISVAMVMSGLVRASSISTSMTDQFFRAALSVIGRSSLVKTRLFTAGVHMFLMNVIHKESKMMHAEEETESSMDHSFGTLLRSYVELLNALFSGSHIETILLKGAADHIMLHLLQSTIYLKRILLRRTRAIDAARFSLEKLLRKVAGKDPLLLMKSAVMSFDDIQDMATQAHVVSVILDVLDPEQKVEEDFLIQIDKDPSQEDFLQGRMTGNPYKSNDPGMGPLMRDIKNKICRDTEMIALMEDDNGMELLVGNVIVSLALPVRAVYEKLWRRTNSAGSPMVIMFRMRGLSGDAVESFVTTLGEEGGETEEDASLALLTKALADCGGLNKARELMEAADMSTMGRYLLYQLKKLFERCIKTETGREEIVRAKLIRTFISTLYKSIKTSWVDEMVLPIGTDFLHLIEAIVNDTGVHHLLSLNEVTEEDMTWLVPLSMRERPREIIVPNGYPIEPRPAHIELYDGVAKCLCSVVLGNETAEHMLVRAYVDILDWQFLDHNRDLVARAFRVAAVERLCDMTAYIKPSKEGLRLKQKMLDSGVLSTAIAHILAHHPLLYSPTESPEWKIFLNRPSVLLILKLMHGLAHGHVASQLALAEKGLPILHRLEQVASDNSIGTIAENVMEALKENKAVAEQIEAVRKETKQKKKQMAMAMRTKQLNRMGMQVGKQGEVKVSSRKIANEPVLDSTNDPLTSCCICWESLFQGVRVSGAYAFASIGQVISASGSKSAVHQTVSQMVMVHIDCHLQAIRRSGGGRNIDEWTKASLHNAGTKCNILTPIAMGNYSEKDWATAIAKYQNDLEIVLPIQPLSRNFVFTDICILIDKFILYKSFSSESMGGGRESNAQYLCVLHLFALSLPAEDPLIMRNCKDRIIGFLMTELTLQSWNEQRTAVLRASLDDGLSKGMTKNFNGLKELCLTWAFVDMFFNSVVMIDGDDRLEWLRTNFNASLKCASKFILQYDERFTNMSDFVGFAAAANVDIEELEPYFQ